ncbi:MotE family protein [Desulfothermus okinawensis]
MKSLLFSVVTLIIVTSLFKASYLIYIIVKQTNPIKHIDQITNINLVENNKNMQVSDTVFRVKSAQAAETKSQDIPKPSDKLLAEQWEKLRAKEAELKLKEEQLKKLEKKIEQKLQEQKKLAWKIEELIKKAEVLKNKKIKHLVQVYSNMDPARAAKVLETLDKQLAVKILAGMKGRTAGEILTNMDPKKAAELSEALTEFQTPFGK